MSQIQKELPGAHKHLPWAGTKGEDETEEDKIDENGTDYNGVEKSIDGTDKLYKSLFTTDDTPPFRRTFLDYVDSNPVLVKGIQQSPFLAEMVKSVHLTFERLGNQAGIVMSEVDVNQTDFAKSLDDTFGVIGERLGIISTTSSDIEKAQGGLRTPKSSSVLEKGGFEAQLSRNEVLDRLVKGVEEGRVAPVDVIRFESTGLLPEALQKSLGI